MSPPPPCAGSGGAAQGPPEPGAQKPGAPDPREPKPAGAEGMPGAGGFEALGVLPELAGRLALRRISRPTAAQRMAIPPLLEGKSSVFRAATGTGKTFAFLLPALQRMLLARGIGAGEAGSAPGGGKPPPPLPPPPPSYQGPELLVCAPTLELCSQIKGELDFLLGAGEEGSSSRGRGGESGGIGRGGGAALLIGSASLARQIEGLKKGRPLAAVGSPGRILLLAKMGRLSFRGLRFLAIDEADRLASPECRAESAELAQALARGAGREGLAALTVAACSATASATGMECLRPLLDGAAFLETDEQEILRERIEHWALFSEGRRKARALASFLAAARPKKALVFAGRSYDAAKAASELQRRKIAAEGLFSGMGKSERKSALDRFRSGKASVLVSSDLAARGLDIPGITHVVALDVGESPDAYIHRAGRTGRAGSRGVMACIGDELDLRRLSSLEKKLGIAVYPKELCGGRILAPAPIEEGEAEEAQNLPARPKKR